MFTWIRHNQGLFGGIIITLALLFWVYGCESQVRSLVKDKLVTRSELTVELNSEARRLESELDNLKELAASRFEELNRKDIMKEKLFEFASIAAKNNSLNPVGIITLCGSLLGVGVLVDNRIKDKVIANRPLNNTTVA